jgi:hypothetical protein
MPNRVIHPIMDKTTSATSYAASGVTTTGGLFFQVDWLVVVGITFTILTFIVNWWYQRRKDLREAEYQRIQAEREALYRTEQSHRDAEYHTARMRALGIHQPDEASGD